jgi:hypothetical protein
MKHLLLRAAAICSPFFAAALFAVPVHAAPFAVTAPTPTATFEDAATEYTSTFSSGSVTVEHCELSIDGVLHGTMTLTGTSLNGTAKRTASIATAGAHTVRVTCTDDDLHTDIFADRTVTVSADTNAPAVGVYTLTPAAPVAGSSFTIQSNYDDTDFGSGLNTCSLVVDANIAGSGTMTLSGGVGSTAGTASRTTTVTTAGSHNLVTNCYDRSGNLGTRTQTVVFSAPPDVTAPDVSLVTPTTAVKDVATTITGNYSDSVGVTSCKLDVDGVNQGSMTLSGTQATKSHTFTALGNHTVAVNCSDAALNTGTKTITTNVTAAPVDTTSPVVSSVVPTSATVGVAVNIQATVSDDTAVSSCSLEINGVNQGSMTVAAGLATKAMSFTLTGDNAVKVTCVDAAGNSGLRSILINVASGSSADTTAPIVSSINPSTATAGSSVNVSASFSDAVGVATCNLYVSGSLIGSMDRSGTTAGTATRSYAFTSAGNYNVEVRCSDNAGNTGSTSRSVTVITAGTAGPYAGRIVKLVCPAGYIDVNHPCKAVYYVGSDGKRHAFPNERVFFTWYSNFDGIIELSGSALSGITLGNNVNYRPGVKMVKFTTLNKVYAVGRYGSLRWVTTEGIATSLYGSTWNTRIDDLSDAFFTDYTFGSDVTPTAAFSPSAETSGVSSIDANLR